MPETKTPEELKALIMAELSKHPDCAGVEVVMNPPVRGLPWGVAIHGSGKQINNRCRKVVETIANELRAKFDIA